MRNDFDILRKSVMFNLSLSSIELFHSNILSYFFSYDNSIFCEIVGVANFEFEIKREHKNIDIEIIGKHSKFLIENKVKDIIGISQIEKIEKCFNGKGYNKYILFSLLGNNLENIGIKTTNWKEIGYNKIIDILQKHNFSDQYLELLKNDYCIFMYSMISLLQNHFLKCNNYIFYNDNNIFKQFESIRLHDVFIKYGISHFCNYFNKQKLKNEINFHGMINHGMATMVFFKKIDGIVFGIETENLDYRRFIVGTEESLEEFEDYGWFNKNWKSATGKKYLVYGNPDMKLWYPNEKLDKNKYTFWYQNGFPNRKLENIDYDNLISFIEQDLSIINIKKEIVKQK